MRKRDAAARDTRSMTLDPVFTDAEREQLHTLRYIFTDHVEHSEMLMDVAELDFARWLYEHGRISEDLPQRDSADTRS